MLALPLLLITIVDGSSATLRLETRDTQPKLGINTSYMDRSVKVKEPSDLSKLAYGKWFRDTVIPNDKPGVGSFDIVYENNRRILHKILEAAAADRTAKPNSSSARVGLFYRVAMNQTKANRLGLRPIQTELQEIAAIKNRRDLIRTIADLQSKGVGAAFAAQPQQDDFNENRMVATFGQGGQILPDRETYWSADGAPLRQAYIKSGTALFSLAGPGQYARATAEGALSLETRLARVSSTPVELRDVAANYNLLTMGKLKAMCPSIDWNAYWEGVGVKAPKDVNVGQLKFFKGLDQVVRYVPLSNWRAYLKMQLLYSISPYLSDEAAKSQFVLASTIQGQSEREARWKRASDSTDASIGEALGPLFVKAAFSPAAKTRIRLLVHNLLTALGERIPSLTWMSEVTKKKALVKLSKFMVKVGYPDKWRDYSRLHLKSDSWAQNVMRSNHFEWNRQWAKLGKPIDRTEWGMTVSQVNAYYNQYNNEIVFPAGILQPGYFWPNADDASNYGAIGMVIGHEITHGFDDQGSQFDGTGRRANWWTAEDKKNFDQAGQGLIKQYDGLTDDFGQKVKGKLTLGENMADVGGLAIAYLAYQASLNGKPDVEIDGLTGDQRFFIAASQSFLGKVRKAYSAMLVASDPHSPVNLRSYVPSSDNAAFYKAFGLEVPTDLPHVW